MGRRTFCTSIERLLPRNFALLFDSEGHKKSGKDAHSDMEIAINLINYFEGRRAIRVGVDSFFFQEGQADDYARARYAEVRILENGGVMLINLTDENLVVINPD